MATSRGFSVRPIRNIPAPTAPEETRTTLTPARVSRATVSHRVHIWERWRVPASVRSRLLVPTLITTVGCDDGERWNSGQGGLGATIQDRGIFTRFAIGATGVGRSGRSPAPGRSRGARRSSWAIGARTYGLCASPGITRTRSSGAARSPRPLSRSAILSSEISLNTRV